MRVFSFLRHYSQGNRFVMAGLDPAIHVFGASGSKKDVDARVTSFEDALRAFARA